MQDTADSLARAMINDIGRLRSITHMLGRSATASSWYGVRRGLAVMWALILA